MEIPSIDVATIGEDVPLLEGIRTARAIRRLRPDPVPPALIRKVCEAGTFAPSGGNRQPWTFIAVTEPDRRRFVGGRYQRGSRAAPPLAQPLHEAPVHLFVAGWLRRGDPQLQALYPAVQNVLLACRAVGLGASLTNVHLAYPAAIGAFLGLPADRPTCALLPIGLL